MNPESVHAPVGAYTHTAVVPAGMELVFVAGQDLEAVRAARERHFGSHRPTATLVFVSRLVDPKLLLEVDAVAVRAAR